LLKILRELTPPIPHQFLSMKWWVYKKTIFIPQQN